MKDYKKILEGVVDIINTTEKSDIGFANICTYISENCPELKESEDEGVKNYIISCLNNQLFTEGSQADIERKKAIAWLEKQGERKSLDDIAKEVTKDKDAAISFFKSAGIINKNGELADEYKIKQDEQKSQEVVDNLHNYLYGEQKPAWNEEDEVALCDALWCCKQAASIAKDENDMGNIWYAENWLKSLKDRVQPQPNQEWKQENTDDLTDFENAMMHIGGSFFGDNAGLDPNDTNAIKEQANLLLELVPKQEWSEEDERFLNVAINILNSSKVYTKAPDKYEDTINWLKSLRPQLQQKWSEKDERVRIALFLFVEAYGSYANYEVTQEEMLSWLKSLRPQNKWKPSKEQMEAFKNAIHIKPYENPSDSLLWGLYEQLKKLREE